VAHNEVLIEEAVCFVPKTGSYAKWLRQRDELRETKPEIAAMVEEIPGYFEHRGDNMAWIEIEYVDPDGISKGCRLYIDFADAKAMSEDDETARYGDLFTTHEAFNLDNVKCGFNLNASFALGMLKTRGCVPTEATLSNDDEAPWDVANRAETNSIDDFDWNDGGEQETASAA
jgi:hypothetical protein